MSPHLRTTILVFLVAFGIVVGMGWFSVSRPDLIFSNVLAGIIAGVGAAIGVQIGRHRKERKRERALLGKS